MNKDKLTTQVHTGSSKAERSRARVWLIGVLMFGSLSALYYTGLGEYGLFDPWETHYGEVARDMVERGNYIDPFWGAPWDSDGVKRERAGFYSKPPLTMWMMASGMKLLGFNAWGVRLFFPLLALCALLSVYLTISRALNHSAAVCATLCTALIPSFSFMSHQAVTDGPLVSLVILAMMALLSALISTPRERASSALRWGVVSLVALVIFSQLWVIWPMDRSPDAVRVSPYSSPLISAQWYLNELWTVGRGKGWVLATLLSPLSAYLIYRVSQLRESRELYFALFFVWCGLTIPAKGWLGWAPTGGALFFYLLLSREWHWVTFRRVRLGLLTVILTGHTWVIAMLGGHHPAWVNRFIYHDHINRLFRGVHSTDDGGFEYFIQWIGYGLYPLIALLPLALVYALTRGSSSPLELGCDDTPDRDRGAGDLESTEREQHNRRTTLLLLSAWALISFTLFTRSHTKFHHYIFPALPAFTLLIGIYVSRFWRGQARLRLQATLVALGVMWWVGGDLFTPSRAPAQGAQHWVNTFTYKYDRVWPVSVTADELKALEERAVSKAWREHLSVPLSDTALRAQSDKLDKAHRDLEWNRALTAPIWRLTLIATLGLILLSLRGLWVRRSGVIALGLSAALACGFSLHTYLPTVATHWSQWELWSDYYQRCRRFPHTPEGEAAFKSHLLSFSSRIPADLDALPAWCRDPVIAFRMNWRGEAFYTHNTVVPALYTKDLKPILKNWGVWKEWSPGKRFFIFTERSRVSSELERSLPKYLKGKHKEVFGEGRRFVLLEVNLDEQEKSNVTKKSISKGKFGGKAQGKTEDTSQQER